MHKRWLRASSCTFPRGELVAIQSEHLLDRFVSLLRIQTDPKARGRLSGEKRSPKHVSVTTSRRDFCATSSTAAGAHMKSHRLIGSLLYLVALIAMHESHAAMLKLTGGSLTSWQLHSDHGAGSVLGRRHAAGRIHSRTWRSRRKNGCVGRCDRSCGALSAALWPWSRWVSAQRASR